MKPVKFCCRLLALAILLAGCSSSGDNASEELDIPTPVGLHLLTQAEAQIVAPDKITYQIYLFADGSEACGSLNVNILWSEILRNRVLKEIQMTKTGSLPPRTSGQVVGEAELNITQFSNAELQQAIRDTRITLMCANQNYERVISFDS